MILDKKIYTSELARNISGVNDQNLDILKKKYNIDLSIRGEDIICSDVSIDVKEKLELIFESLLFIADKDITITNRDVLYLLNLLEQNQLKEGLKVYENRRAIGQTQSGKMIYPKTLTQIKYVNALDKKDMVFAIGPAGTGKTYLAVVYAVRLLKQGLIKKIILTRPAVEAGESLGFLPGDLKEKVDPYLRPLYDALYDTLGVEVTNSLIEKEVIEIAPLAYMRGRTLENAFVILDEAQNTTDSQMKMFLTRLGFNTKMVITGDITQIDLPHGVTSGLKKACSILRDINEIAIIEFLNFDVVRHLLVQKIIECYEK